MLNNAQPPHWLRHWATPLWPAQWCCNSMRKGSLIACFNSHQLYRLLKVVAVTLLPIVPSNLCTKASRLQGTCQNFMSSGPPKVAKVLLAANVARVCSVSWQAPTHHGARPNQSAYHLSRRNGDFWNFGGQIELKSLPYPKKTVDP